MCHLITIITNPCRILHGLILFHFPVPSGFRAHQTTKLRTLGKQETTSERNKLHIFPNFQSQTRSKSNNNTKQEIRARYNPNGFSSKTRQKRKYV